MCEGIRAAAGRLTRRLSRLLRPARQRSRFAAAGCTSPAPARAAERSRRRARAMSPISLDASRLSCARVQNRAVSRTSRRTISRLQIRHRQAKQISRAASSRTTTHLFSAASRTSKAKPHSSAARTTATMLAAARPRSFKLKEAKRARSMVLSAPGTSAKPSASVTASAFRCCTYASPACSNGGSLICGMLVQTVISYLLSGCLCSCPPS